ncbi:MAG: glycosyltransferase family 2 protein [Hahellaceae bacterium]|nr:glycosyltransferase family 2 protein [Hahellaceae bacterium]MCP5211313.1 glycosyltransferase family 2 protein [Hahellaceae bacterium]
MSCVLYNSDPQMLRQTFYSLGQSISVLDGVNVSLDVIDNASVKQFYDMPEIGARCYQVHEHFGHGNIGFGAGHNLSIKNASSTYHLILNPDVILDPSTLQTALAYMDANPDVVLLSPESRDPASGEVQFQCKGYPSLLVLALRLLNIAWLNSLFASPLARYEERERIRAGKPFAAMIVSGCFMLFRTDALKALGGFDERYFLYFEDFDLSLRAQKLGRVVYYPGVRIQHYGGGAGRKGWRHIKMFLRSALTFFNRHGWKWF